MHVNVSRSKIEVIQEKDVMSLGASYTHVRSLHGVLGPSTKKVVMYHSFLTSLAGFEPCTSVDLAYLGFNRIERFRPEDAQLFRFGVLDLAGNPLQSLQHCPPCHTLIVSATCIKDLTGAPEGIEIIRCGHSAYLQSLKGCPSSVKLIECAAAPLLRIDRNDLPLLLEELLS